MCTLSLCGSRSRAFLYCGSMSDSEIRSSTYRRAGLDGTGFLHRRPSVPLSPSTAPLFQNRNSTADRALASSHQIAKLSHVPVICHPFDEISNDEITAIQFALFALNWAVLPLVRFSLIEQHGSMRCGSHMSAMTLDYSAYVVLFPIIIR